MNSKFVSSALILSSALIAGTSFAFNGGALTREQVQASLVQARATGSLPAVGDEFVAVLPSATSTLSREAVKADYFAARAAGTLPAPVEGPTTFVSTGPSQLSREAVELDFFSARTAGTLPKVSDAF